MKSSALSYAWLLAACALSPVNCMASRQGRSTPQVTVKNGTLIGLRHQELNQDFFLGIPYAQPPTNNLRFQKPVSIDKGWHIPRLATEYGSFCRHVPLSLPGFTQQGFNFTYDEDCLTLNIIQPKECTPTSELPVLFWIHGGGLQDGGSGDPRYNMSFVVDESVQMGTPIIAVSINYRLSGWGFLSGRAMNESENSNMGLHDQRLALRWVQENIQAFGGDPNKVTIQGESSGGLSVGYHLLAHGGDNDNLFRAAIEQSGGVVNPNGPLNLDEQDLIYNQVLNSTGCNKSEKPLECLRATPADVLDDAFKALSFGPIIDGSLVPGVQSDSLREGKFAKVPLLIGTNRNEGTAMASLSGRLVNDSSAFMALIKGFDSVGGFSNSTIKELSDAYTSSLSLDEVQDRLGTVLVTPDSTFGALYGQASIFLGDFLFDAPRRFSTQIWSRFGVPAYSFRFDAVPNGISPEVLGATHFQEVAFVFRNFAGEGYDVNPFGSNPTQLRQLSAEMAQMWISFVVTLNPNNHQVRKDSQTWPVYTNENPKNMLFSLPTSTIELDSYGEHGIARLIEAFGEIRV